MALTKATTVNAYQGRPPVVITDSVEDKVMDGRAGLRKHFGAVGDGQHDDTDAFEKWMDCLTDATYKRLGAFSDEHPYMLQKGPQLMLEDGAFVYAGKGLNIPTNHAFVLNIIGQSSLSTKIILPEDVYFLDLDNNPVFSYMSDITFHGGLGTVRMKSKSRNATSMHIFERLRMSRYKQCAFSNNSIDMPYVKIRDSVFMGDFSRETIGLCLSGLSAGSDITGNQFTDNRYNLKLAVADNGVERNGPPTPLNIVGNDFYRTGDRQGASYDIWIEPGKTATNSGRGLVLQRNKFGQENLKSPDAHILIADSGTGQGGDLNGDRMHVETKSSGFVSGILSEGNNVNSINGSYTAPYIRSFTPNFGNNKIHDIYDNGMPSRIVEFAGGITQSEVVNISRTNMLEIDQSLSLQKGDVPNLLSNLDGVFRVRDDLGLLAGHPQVHDTPTGSQMSDFLHVYKGPTSSIAVADATRVSIDNSYGGKNEAAEFTMTTEAGRAVATVTGLIAGDTFWLDFEVKRSADNAAPHVLLEVLDSSASTLLLRRTILLDAKQRWQKVVLPFVPNSSGSILVRFKAKGWTSSNKKFQVGNLNVYRNPTPVNTGHNGGLSSSWSSQHMLIGSYHLWVDASGALRIKDGAPTSVTDGAIVGNQAGSASQQVSGDGIQTLDSV